MKLLAIFTVLLFSGVGVVAGNQTLTREQALINSYDDDIIPPEIETFLDNLRRSVAIGVARLYLLAGQPEQAIALMTELVSTNQGQNPNDLAARAQIYALAFEFDKAISDMDTAIELESDNPAFYVQRGQIRLLLYEWDRVLEDYNAALEIDPAYTEVYFHRGVLYYTILDRENALADFETYLFLQPTSYGEFVGNAQSYSTSIRAELDALNSP